MMHQSPVKLDLSHNAGLKLNGWLKTGLLLGLGLYFVYNIVSGNLTNYINIRFAWLSYLAAALFLLLGAASLIGLLRAGRAHEHTHDHHHDHDHDHHHDHAHHDHDHSHGTISWSTLAIVAVPLLLGTLIPSRPLGAEAIDGSIAMNAAVSRTAVEAYSKDPMQRNVLDWLRAFNTVEDYSELNGLPADLTGFVYRQPDFEADTFMLARFTVSCCVADASAIGVPVRWEGAGTLDLDTWKQVEGTFQVGTFRGERVPVLVASQVTTIEQPEHPYLYP